MIARFLICIVTLVLFCTSCRNAIVSDNKPYIETGYRLYIQPFQETEASTLSFLSNQLPAVYNFSVRILPPRQLPANAWYPERRRYWADSILKYLTPFVKDNRSYILGVTGKDISTKKSTYPNWGVMGLGFVTGHCSIISDYRLQVYPGTASQTDSQLLKVAIHELGHNFGLTHCPDKTCYMADAEGKNNSAREFHFCENCYAYLQKLQALV